MASTASLWCWVAVGDSFETVVFEHLIVSVDDVLAFLIRFDRLVLFVVEATMTSVMSRKLKFKVVVNQDSPGLPHLNEHESSRPIGGFDQLGIQKLKALFLQLI